MSIVLVLLESLACYKYFLILPSLTTAVVRPTPSTGCTPSRACRASQWTLSTAWPPPTTPRQTRGESSSAWGLSGPTALSTTNSRKLSQWRSSRGRTPPARRGWTDWRSRYSPGGTASPPVWPVNWSRWARPRPTLTIPALSVVGTGRTEPLQTFFSAVLSTFDKEDVKIVWPPSANKFLPEILIAKNCLDSVDVVFNE